MDINSLTIGEAKEISALFSTSNSTEKEPYTISCYIGQHVIVRTYSAGVWFGVLSEKSSNEVILKDARRMWRWKALQGISLSACAIYGIDQDYSKIVEAVESVWLEAIEIIPATSTATETIKGAENVKAK